jgi:GMP synthase-like glutamine amidotransferase
MGQLMETGDEKWKFFNAYEYEFPSDEDLATIRTIIFPGSSRSAYDTSVSWVGEVKDFIRRVMNEYPHIKIIGGCFGKQATAMAMGGNVEKMPFNAERPKIIGREEIKPTDEFFEQGFVKRFMDNNQYTRETFPKIVL